MVEHLKTSETPSHSTWHQLRTRLSKLAKGAESGEGGAKSIEHESGQSFMDWFLSALYRWICPLSPFRFQSKLSKKETNQQSGQS